MLPYKKEIIGYLPEGLDSDIQIVDAKANIYQYWNYKYNPNASYDNVVVALQVKHRAVKELFWIVLFKGAQYRDDDVQFVEAYKEFSNFHDAVYSEGGISFKDSLEEEEIVAIKEVERQFDNLWFKESEDSEEELPLIMEDSCALEDFANIIISKTNLIVNIQVPFEEIDESHVLKLEKALAIARQYHKSDAEIMAEQTEVKVLTQIVEAATELTKAINKNTETIPENCFQSDMQGLAPVVKIQYIAEEIENLANAIENGVQKFEKFASRPLSIEFLVNAQKEIDQAFDSWKLEESKKIVANFLAQDTTPPLLQEIISNTNSTQFSWEKQITSADYMPDHAHILYFQDENQKHTFELVIDSSLNYEDGEQYGLLGGSELSKENFNENIESRVLQREASQEEIKEMFDYLFNLFFQSNTIDERLKTVVAE
jgi:hypothetical protein